MTLPANLAGASPPVPPVSPVVLSAFWFGTAFHWLVLLLIVMPKDVVKFVGEGQ